MSNVNKVFATKRATYPAWYEKYYRDQKSEHAAKRIWLTGIKELTTEQVEQGLQRMVVEYEFPPKLKEFIQLCKQIDGLACLDIAWGEALLGRYSHPIIKATAELTGLYELKQASYDNYSLKKRFEHYFAKVSENFTQGKPLKEVTKEIADTTNQLLEAAEEQSKKRVLQRVKQQGINQQNAREICLALLGIKRHKYDPND